MGSTAAALLLYAALAVLVFLPAWLHPTTTAIGLPGDPQQSIWFLSWTPWAISHGVNPFFTTHLNFPDGINLMWNSWAPLLGFVLWPITATGGPVLAYNVLQTAGIALSAWLAFLAARRYLPGWAATATGLVYGFGPFLLVQAHGHAKVSFGLLPPLLFILGDEILVRRTRSPRTLGILLGLAVAAQTLILEESVVLALVSAAIGVAVVALLSWSRVREHWRRGLVALAWSVAVFAVIAAGPLAVQLFGIQKVHGNVPGAGIYITDPVAVVVPTSLQWLHFASLSTGVEAYAGNVVETGASYLGLPLLLIALITVVAWWRRPLVRWSAITAVIVAVFALGPELQVAGNDTPLPLPYKLLHGISHLGSALPAHFFVYVDFLLALLAGVFVAEMVRIARQGRTVMRVRAAGGAVLAGLTVLTLVPQVPFATTALDVPDFFTTADLEQVGSGSVALVAPWVQDGSLDDPMVWQATAGLRFKMPDGYFIRPNKGAAPRSDGPTPTTTSRAMIAIATTGRAPELTAQVRSAVLRDLRRWKVKTVVVGPMAHGDVMEQFFASVLNKPAARRGGVLIWKLD